MSRPNHDLLAIGNALVDVLAPAEDSFIAGQEKHGMMRGAMNLVDQARALEIYGMMAPAVQVSGGSAGNTMAGFASFGGRGAYIGKVADDELGRVFAHDLKAQGVDFSTVPLVLGAQTGRCMVLITPDGQRTMNTYLGAAVELSTADIDEELVSGAGITYLEGYLFDPPQAKDAFRLAATYAHAAGRRVALSLSDAFCVERHRADLLSLVENHVDILFANETEIGALYGTSSYEESLRVVTDNCEIAALTRGGDGSSVIADGKIFSVPALDATVLDTTGAGDQYAAGFLFGFTQGMNLKQCAKLGTLAATEVIGHVGPRPSMKYSDLLRKVD